MGPQEEQPLYDVAIIGSGPAGTTAAIYAARARLSAVMIDKATLGGALGITGRIANYPGLGFDREMSGADLLCLMHEHARSFGTAFVQSQVYGLSLEGEVKEVYTAEGVQRAKTIIIATGAGSRDNKLPGEEEYLGRGVSYCATCDAAFYGGRTVAVLGNSPEAVEEALVLAKFAGRVLFFNPANRFIAEEDAVAQLAALPNVEIKQRFRALGVQGEQTVNALRLGGPEGELTIPVDGVFIYLPGNKPATGFLQGLVDLDERGYVVTDAQTQTSVPGVFAAGDVRGNDLQQVVIACADGCVAALAADRYINKRARTLSQR
jgi:thioredoxin reductase (NADPH)